MPTAPRPFYPSGIYHVYNRSSQKMPLFRELDDYERLIFKAITYKKLFPVEVLSYCLMPNHFHFLVREPIPTRQKDFIKKYQREDYFRLSNISKFFHALSTAYAKYFGIKYKFAGSVFGQPFRAKQVADDGYLQTIIAYIHDNPVRAKLVKNPVEWPHSSYAGLTNACLDELVTYDDKLSDLNHQKIWELFARDRNKSTTTITQNLIRHT
jgi:putative transposase